VGFLLRCRVPRPADCHLDGHVPHSISVGTLRIAGYAMKLAILSRSAAASAEPAEHDAASTESTLVRQPPIVA